VICLFFSEEMCCLCNKKNLLRVRGWSEKLHADSNRSHPTRSRRAGSLGPTVWCATHPQNETLRRDPRSPEADDAARDTNAHAAPRGPRGATHQTPCMQCECATRPPRAPVTCTLPPPSAFGWAVLSPAARTGGAAAAAAARFRTYHHTSPGQKRRAKPAVAGRFRRRRA
jgi:hypothetical protein